MIPNPDGNRRQRRDVKYRRAKAQRGPTIYTADEITFVADNLTDQELAETAVDCSALVPTKRDGREITVTLKDANPYTRHRVGEVLQRATNIETLRERLR